LNSPAAAIIAALAFSNFCGAADAACQLTPQGEGSVATVIDARTFRLDDGRDIRLAGIETNVAGADANQSTAALTSLIDHRAVVLQGDGDKPDRYGRETAVVLIAGSPKSLQTELLSRGAVLMAASVSDPGCATKWKTAEDEARVAKRGLWGDGLVTKKRKWRAIFWLVSGG
jgi:endonuclease YncB( thermonuclease family)